MAYTKPSWSRTSVVLLRKLGHPGLHQGPTPSQNLLARPPYRWHTPQGVPRVGIGYDFLRKSDYMNLGPIHGPDLRRAWAGVWGAGGGGGGGASGGTYRSPSSTRSPRSGRP